MAETRYPQGCSCNGAKCGGMGCLTTTATVPPPPAAAIAGESDADLSRVYALIVAMFRQPDEIVRSMQAQDLSRELKMGTWAPTKEVRNKHFAAAREMLERDKANGFLPDPAASAPQPQVSAAPAPAAIPQAARNGLNVHLLWRDACEEWGKAVGGPHEYEIFAEKLLSAASAPKEPTEPTDGKMLDWLEAKTHEGYCPALIFDDDGHWAVMFDGVQSTPGDGPPFATSHWAGDETQWFDSVREAIRAAMRNTKP
jgi:hypothetical protein